MGDSRHPRASRRVRPRAPAQGQAERDPGTREQKTPASRVKGEDDNEEKAGRVRKLIPAGAGCGKIAGCQKTSISLFNRPSPSIRKGCGFVRAVCASPKPGGA